MTKDLSLAFVYFMLSTLITWWFVAYSPLYISTQQMILSTAVAGGKWAIQVGLGILLLKQKAPRFLREIGFVCLVGSLLLLPYALLAYLKMASASEFFVGSLIVAVLTMIYFYFKAVKAVQISMKWWTFWLLCLATAISLQLTVVFDVIRFD